MALTLTVNENTYISRANATLYFEGALHGASWVAATDTVKDQALVTATRMLDRQRWQGSKYDSEQALAWPRSGVTDREGNSIDETAVPQDILDATCELALSLIIDSDVQNSSSSSQNIKRVQAGSASVEYFRPTFGGRFPTIVQELVGYLLSSSAAGLLEPWASGTDVESYFDNNNFDVGSTIR